MQDEELGKRLTHLSVEDKRHSIERYSGLIEAEGERERERE